MPDVNLPLSGAVTQSFQSWTSLFSPSGSQMGLFNINLGVSSDDAVEKAVIANVASYGKQLGRIGDALLVLLHHLPPGTKLEPREEQAITDLKSMLNEIANVKTKYGSKNVHRS